MHFSKHVSVLSSAWLYLKHAGGDFINSQLNTVSEINFYFFTLSAWALLTFTDY